MLHRVVKTIAEGAKFRTRLSDRSNRCVRYNECVVVCLRSTGKGNGKRSCIKSVVVKVID